MGNVLWSVREGRVGDFKAPVLANGFRSTNHLEPKLGEVLYLPDGSGPWRVVDWAVTSLPNASGNVLVVQPAAA
jgi:hypothetical protein